VEVKRVDEESTPQIPTAPVRVFRDRLKIGGEGPEMVVVPAGTFQMGGRLSGEQPVHAVRIQKPFAIGRYEVTFDDYDRFAKSTGKSLPRDYDGRRGKLPVVHVSWHDAMDYAKWLSVQTGKFYRLPTEAEWEYAARSGGKNEIWAGTSNEKQLAAYAVYLVHRIGQMEPVGSRKPNGLGLYDMTGNVWEWVEDCWHNNYSGAPADGSPWLEAWGGDCGHRVRRGGAWYNNPGEVRTSYRTGGSAVTRDGLVGFRLAQDLP
jgi:formylglycine-generating enzyme required for sulfatase activity